MVSLNANLHNKATYKVYFNKKKEKKNGNAHHFLKKKTMY